MMLSPEYNDLTKLVMPKGKREHIDSSLAITKYRVLDSNYGVSLVECQPVTGTRPSLGTHDSHSSDPFLGVKHQIRTHLAHALGTPILGDHKYSHYAKLAPQVMFTFTLSPNDRILSLRNYRLPRSRSSVLGKRKRARYHSACTRTPWSSQVFSIISRTCSYARVSRITFVSSSSVFVYG